MQCNAKQSEQNLTKKKVKIHRINFDFYRIISYYLDFF